MRRAAKILLWILLGIVALAALLLGALQLPATQRQLAAHLPEWTGGMVEVQGLEGTLPQHLRIAHLAVRDGDGVWLEIEQLALDWRPWAWLHHEVAIDRLEIARVHVIRAPLPGTAAGKTQEPFRLPDLPRLSLTRLVIAEIALEPAVTGQMQRLTLSGQARPSAQGQGFTLALDTLEGTPTQLRAEGTIVGQNIQTTLQAQEAPGGLLGHLAQIAPEAGLQLAGQGNWDGAHLNARLRAQENDIVLADLTIASKEARWALTLEGTLPSQMRAQPNFAPLRAESGADYHLAGEVWAEGQAWHWQIAQGDLGCVTLRSNGTWPQVADAPLQAEAAMHAPLAPWSGLAGRALGGQASLQVVASGTLAALQTKLELALPDGVLDGQTLPEMQLTAQLAQQGRAWNIAPLAMHLGAVTATGEARYDALKWQAHFTLPPVALAAWRALLPPGALPAEFDGNLGLQLQAEGAGGEWKADAQAALDALRGLPEAARGAVGNTARLEARLAQSGGILRIEQAELTSAGGLRATTEGTLENGVADIRAQLGLKDARVLGAGIPGGAPELHATWKGKPEAGDATFQLAWAAPGLPKLEAEGKAALDADTIRLPQLLARFGPAELRAEGTLPRKDTQGGTAHARLHIPDLAPLGKLAGQDLAGSMHAEGTLQGKAVKVTLEAKDLRTAAARAARLQGNASVTDWSDLQGLVAQLQGSGLSGEGWGLDKMTARAQSEPKPKDAPTPPIAWNFDATGNARDQPLALAVAGRWQQPKAGQHLLQLARLNGRALGEKLTLDGPTEARFGQDNLGQDNLALSPTRLSWGPLHVAARLVQAKGQVEGALQLEKVALDQLRHLGNLPRGTIEAQATLNGPLAAPKAAWSATAHLTPAEGTRADVALNGDWQGGPRATPLQTTLHATTAQEGGSQGALDGTLATAGRLSLQPITVELLPSAPLSGRFTGQLPLALLNNWLRADGHKLDGETKLDLALGGTLEAPKPSGAITLAHASYDHLPSGLCLRNLEGEIQASAEQLRLVSLSATDADKRRLQASGSIGLAGNKPVDLTLAMPAHRLFCGGMASGDVAGDLRIQGNLAQRLAATGKLTIGPMAVTLPEGDKAGDIPQLKVIEPKKTKKEEKPGILDLGIDVAVPGRLFVRGRGLDAEFAGDLKIRGTGDAPDVVGDLSTKRGRFTLLDRQLGLTRAILRFAGAVPPSPSLDILAETNVQDTTLRVTLAGSALAPKLELSSTPALPSDEVLALLLFGRKLESISAFQALQLAQAARQLAGKGGGPGAIDSVRNLLGLDTLSLDQDASGESTVGTGKYLADGVYVGLEQGRKPESRKVRTELEVIPDVNVQTTTTSDGQTGAGVEWKYDY